MAVAESKQRSDDRDAYEKAAKIREALVDARLPRKHRRRQIETGGRYERWAAMLEDFRGRLGTGFTAVLLGGNGPGKTQLGVQLLRYACEQFLERDVNYPEITRPGTYYTGMQMFMTLREAFNVEGKTELGQQSLFTCQRLLIIDEFDKPRGTEWEHGKATEVIDERDRMLLETVLIANGTENAIAARLGKSAWSRLTDKMGTGGVAVADWGSFREAVK